MELVPHLEGKSPQPGCFSGHLNTVWEWRITSASATETLTLCFVILVRNHLSLRWYSNFQRLHNCTLLSLGYFKLVCGKLKVLNAVSEPSSHKSQFITNYNFSLSLSSFSHLYPVPLSGMCLQNLLSVELHPSGFKNSTGRLTTKELRGLDKPFLDEPVRVIQFNH